MNFSKILCLIFTFIFSSVLYAQEIIIEETINAEYKVVSLFEVKKGDSCIKLTKLTFKECVKLGKKYGRTPKKLIAPNGEEVWEVPLYKGEQLALVHVKDGQFSYLTYILSRK